MQSIVPVLCDTRPTYLAADGDADAAASLLLLSAGGGTVLSELAGRLAAAAQRTAPLILPSFTPGPRYEAALRRELPGVGDLIGADLLRDPLARFDVSDTLLLVSAECYPLEGIDFAPLLNAGRGRAPRRRRDDPPGGARGALRHLLAFETAAPTAREVVQTAADGRLRRVQRLLDRQAWTTPSGVLASVVPVACLLAGGEGLGEAVADAFSGSLAFALPTLRARMAASGLPSEDVAMHARLVDLTDEPGALALTERRLEALFDAARGTRRAAHGAPLALSPSVQLHPTARFVGPVVVAEGARVDAGALVVGPTFLGRGSHVGRQATVAQSLLTAGGDVAAGTSVRHRVVVAAPDAGPGQPPGGPRFGRGSATEDGASAGRSAGGQRREAFGAVPATPERRRGGYLVAKGVAEPIIAAVLLIALAPLFLVLAALVLLDSGRPVFYGDQREGRRGVPFRCWKFRSMRVHAAAEQRALAGVQQLDGPQFKMDRDPRVTRVGRWLRRLNVDELPQLWNVLLGQMSFVGPRPSPFRENQICVPWRRGRLTVRPGITGLWQVCRHDRAAGDFHQWIHYDLLYVQHVSLAVDLRIFVATVLTLGGRRPTPLARIIGTAGAPAAGTAEVPTARPALVPQDATPLYPVRDGARPARRRANGAKGA